MPIAIVLAGQLTIEIFFFWWWWWGEGFGGFLHYLLATYDGKC